MAGGGGRAGAISLPDFSRMNGNWISVFTFGVLEVEARVVDLHLIPELHSHPTDFDFRVLVQVFVFFF